VASTTGDNLSAYEVAVGTGAGNTGSYTMSGGSLTLLSGTPPPLVGGSAASLRVGDFSGTGTFTQTGGTVSVDGSLNIGNQGGTGYYNISGGALNLANGLFAIGRTAGSNPASTGTLNISGAALVNVSGPVGTNFIVGDRDAGGAQGVGTVNQSGGTFVIGANVGLYLAGYGVGNTYNLTGGTLEVGGNSLRANYGGSGTYAFNLGGGTVKVVGSDLVTSVDAALVANTTSTIDTNGLNATWNGAITGPEGELQKIGDGTLTLNGALNFETLTAQDGITNVETAFGTGSSTVNANAEVHFGTSQTVAALNVGAGGVVRLDATGGALAGFGEPASTFGSGPMVATLPEPGSMGLLLVGALGLLGRRRRK
jgi:hypothetical protein